MIQVLHNNRCSKSREAVQFLEEKDVDFQVIYYLENPLNELEINDLLKKLNLSVMEIIRTNENIWKENFKDKNLSEAELIKILAENPKLIQRPIIIKNDKAVIGRPLENLEKLLKK